MGQSGQYRVIKTHDGWKVMHEGRMSSAFERQQEAVQFARVRAKAVNRATGEATAVLIQGREMKWRVHWSYSQSQGSAIAKQPSPQP